MTTDLLADVAVRLKRNSELRSPPVLTYLVPPALRSMLQAGMLVWVPLRQERVQAIVLSLHHATPENRPAFTLRSILDVDDPEVIIPEHGLELAKWIAEQYHASLGDALTLLLPPGAGRTANTTWAVTAAGEAVSLGSLPSAERELLYYLRQHGPVGEDVLDTALQASSLAVKRAASTLAKRGLASRGVRLSPGKARPQFEPTAQPLVNADFDWSGLARAPRQAEVLRELVRRYEQRLQVTGEETQAAEVVPPEEGFVAAAGLPLALLRALERQHLIVLGQREVMRNPLDGQPVARDHPPELTEAQSQVVSSIIAAIEERKQRVFLLHGVTGSGKTEVYLRSIARTLRRGKQAVVLVPEIALTAQVVQRFVARFGPVVAVLHSALSAGQRYDTWRRLRRGEVRIVVGSRSAIFAPLPQLGLIIVDEEHEQSYKQDVDVRYHARDVAIKLGELAHCPVVLGSATPAVESYQATRTGQYELLELLERVAARANGKGTQVVPLPPVTLVDMRVELHHHNLSLFSRALQGALQATLDKQQQAILFLNRRGLASFILCRDCGYVVGCAHCSSPLVVHLSGEHKTALPPGTLLRCHTCGYREAPPNQCPSCWSQRIRHFGAGTQRVVEEVEALFPQARVLRWDRDMTTRKGAHEQLLGALLRHEADIVVGTQMIAKGLDLPLVTLVGVVSADIGLHMPDFRAGERAFQLLAQVAGRAGRRGLGGSVIIQSYTPEHYALQAAAFHDYLVFFREEIAFRAEVHYPPFAQLARLVYSSTSPRSAEAAAWNLTREIEAIIAERKLPATVIGPAPALMEKVRDRYRWHLLVRAPDVHPILSALAPQPGWIIDVDPQNLM